jgi:hypothetical protein
MITVIISNNFAYESKCPQCVEEKLIISIGRLDHQPEQETGAGDGNRRQMAVLQYLKGCYATQPHGQKWQRGSPALHQQIPVQGYGAGGAVPAEHLVKRVV